MDTNITPSHQRRKQLKTCNLLPKQRQLKLNTLTKVMQHLCMRKPNSEACYRCSRHTSDTTICSSRSLHCDKTIWKKIEICIYRVRAEKHACNVRSPGQAVRAATPTLTSTSRTALPPPSSPNARTKG